MRFRGKSVRRKIVALLLVPLLSLTSLWAFTTYLTGREANQLLDVGNVVQHLGYPVENVILALQDERRQSLLYLADRRDADALDALRRRTRATDEAVTALRADTDTRDTREDLTGEAGDRMRGVLEEPDLAHLAAHPGPGQHRHPRRGPGGLQLPASTPAMTSFPRSTPWRM